MKKTITWLLIASLLLAFLASCDPRYPEESTTDAASATEQDQAEQIPADAPSNEEKYKPVLDIFKDIITNLDEQVNSKGSPYSEETREYQWWNAMIGAVASFHLSTNVPGYAFCDLNQNGNDEMLLLLDDYTVLAIFSFADSKPVLLDHYWNRKMCTIEQDGTIQVYGSSSADTSSFSIFEVAQNDKELVLLEEYGTDGRDKDTLELYFYKLSNGDKTPITVLEYTAALSQGKGIYSSVEDLAKHTKENANFEFVPLGLEISYKRVFEKILSYDAPITSLDRYLWELISYYEDGFVLNPEVIEICYLDMDGDGAEELLLRCNSMEYLILRYLDGMVYLYELHYKAIDRVYEDGSFSWHSPTFLEDDSICYGVTKVTFDENGADRRYALYSIYESENESYFIINGKLASKAELDALLESRKDIQEVTWTTYKLDLNKLPSVG